MQIVTGMHRSGTSLVARLLHEAGADFGDEETFYRPDKWNPDGYFEQADVHAINMPLINGRFGKLAYFRLPSAETILERSTGISAQIRDTAKKYEACVVKETRFCLTLPAWLEHGAAVEKVLVCLRHPLMVARSLRRRNRIPLRLGYSLWRQHNERLLENSRQISVRYVLYEAIVNQATYLDEVQPALLFMGLPLSRAEIAEVCAGRIRFRASPDTLATTDLPTSVFELWTSLLESHAGQRAAPSVDKRSAETKG